MAGPAPQVVEDTEETPLIDPSEQHPHKQAGKWRGATIAGALVVASVGIFIALSCTLSQYRVEPTLPANNTVFSFLVVGDWGRGNFNQRRCMRRMNTVAQLWQPEFVISTGDNFYPDGLASGHDPKIKQYFSDMYSHPALAVPWYAVLGNHDYGDGWDNNPLRAHCAANCRSPRWQYTQHFGANDGRWQCRNGTHLQAFHDNLLAVQYIDTTPLLPHYGNTSWANFSGGLNEQDAAAQLAALRASLTSAAFRSATWRIVVGHHGVRSYGEHCTPPLHYDCGNMSFLLPLLEEAKVHLYINGHDHDLQHIKRDNETTHFITSGAGSDVRSREFVRTRAPDAKFLSDKQGFVMVAAARENITASFFHFYSEAAVHHVTISRDL